MISEPSQTLHRALALRSNRRRAAQAIAATAGSLLLLESVTQSFSLFAFAQTDDDDDNSGRGRGRGRGGDDRDNSGPGNADDPDAGDAPVQITGAVPEGAVEVRIVSDDAGGFVPGEFTVDLGQTVAFVNAHDDEHTATGSGFDTGVINSGEVATVLLDTAGRFAYACQIHPEMTGRIGVRAADGVVPETQAAAEEAPAGATTVRIVNLAFDPAQVTIATGTAVSWINEDSVPHTVTATGGAFDSGIFDPGANFTWTFDQPGSFPYACQLHPKMQGTVIAEGDAVASASPVPAESPTAPTAEQGADPGAAAVSIVDLSFEPAILDVPAGATVVWTNEGRVLHTVTGDFADSGILRPGQTFSHTFAETGEFGYACAIHPKMTGTIRVSAAVATAATPTAPSAADGAGPEGVWLMELISDSEAILGAHHALVTFHKDGTVEADFSAESGDGTAAYVLTSGRGEWLLQLPDSVCRLSLITLVNEVNQRFAGTATLNAEAQLDTGGRVLEGSFEFTVIAADGQALGEGSGTLLGESVPLDP